MLVDKYNDSTKKYDQTVSLDGKVVSRLSSGKCSVVSHSFQNTTDTLPQTPVSPKAGEPPLSARLPPVAPTPRTST